MKCNIRAMFCGFGLLASVAWGGMPLEDPIPEPIAQGDVHVRLREVATGLTAPNYGTSAPGIPNYLFVTDQDGQVIAINLLTGEQEVFLDVSGRLVDLGVGGPGSFDERGLLGLAFHPGFQANGLFYTYTSEPVAGPADFSTIPMGESANHQSVITEWSTTVDPESALPIVNVGSERVILRIDQPQFNHDAGLLTFGPDGMLYIALGDGGAGDDQGLGHVPGGNGQDPSNPLGSILRIDPQLSDSANGQYGIPADNPFVGQAGFLDEIYAYGLRNPFRVSFDRATGELYAADVGQNDIEEIDIITSGGNYGWPAKEGSFFFDMNGEEDGFVTATGSAPAGVIDPIAEYDHDEGIAIQGGFVYRGGRIPALAGRYVFGEFAQTFSNDGRLFYLDDTNTIQEFQLVGQDGLGLSLLGFGEDGNGEIYALANGTGVPFGDTGVVLHITPQQGDLTTDGCTNNQDLGILLAAYLATSGEDRYAKEADIAPPPFGDGIINNQDLGALLASYLEGCGE